MKPLNTFTKEYPQNICRVCGKKTKQYFNIDFKKAYICKSCENGIVRQSINEVYGTDK